MPRDPRQSLARQAKKARARFLETLRGSNSSDTQHTLLRSLLTQNRDTVFGREHHFSTLTTLDDYRRAVPIRHYPELAPWIERSAAGESNPLTCEEPIRFWKTTGTTSVPKKVPVTPASASRTMESFLSLQGTQLHYYPEINDRFDTTLVTHISPKPIKEFLGPRRVPYCSTTEVPLEIRRGRETAPWLPGLQEVEENDAVRLYYLLLFASAHDLRCLACLHPSRFQTVVSTLEQKGARLIEELRAGTVLGRPRRDPRPEPADRLEKILRRTGSLKPRDLWPNLRFITGWSGSYINRYRPLMTEYYCSEFLPMPSISSEAFTTMTIDPDPISQPLNLRGGLFEFVPSGSEVRGDSPTLQFFELEPGRSYELIATTLGGLYRYATCDIFKVGGFVDRVPRLEYLGRRSVSDLTGEKLAEEHVVTVLEEALARRGLSQPIYTVCGIQAGDHHHRPHYVLVMEHGGADRPQGLARELDERFKALNSRYELKRNFDDLRPLRVEFVPPGTFARYRERRAAGGAPAGQLKDKVLHADGAQVLEELLGGPTVS